MNRTTAPFTLFSGLWAAHVIFHYTSYASYFVSPLGFAAFASSVYLLLRPSSPSRLALSGYLYALAWFSHIPNTPNHETIGSFVALTFASALVYERLTRGAGFSPVTALERAAPVMRSIVLLMYFWATFHKLNRDFLFDERVSCGTVFYSTFLDRLPFLPAPGPLLNLAMAWATIGVEAAIGVLLLIPRTRRWGIAVGWSFHLMLTLSPKSGFYNFTSLLLLLFLLFAPASLPDRLAEVWRASRVRKLALSVLSVERWRAVPAALGWSVVLLVPLWLVSRHSLAGVGEELFDYFSSNRVWIRDRAFVPWMLWSLPLSYFVWRAFRLARADSSELPGRLAAVPRGLWLITGLFFLWGATPYVGLKTENSFAMFSNLRTESASNHLLVPEALKLFSYQDDPVEVVSVVGRLPNGGRLRNKLGGRGSFEVPYEGLRGWLRTQLRHGATIEQVAYRRNGELIVERYEDGGELFSQGFLAHKLLQFRRYRPKGPMTCEH